MSTADSDYLKETIGEVLSDALAAVAMQQPADPIEFIGKYLLNADATAKRHEQVSTTYTFLCLIYVLCISLIIYQERQIEEEAKKRMEQSEQKKQKAAESAQKFREQRERRAQEKQAKLVEVREALFATFTQHETEKDEGLHRGSCYC